MKVLLPPLGTRAPVEVDLLDRMKTSGVPAVSLAVFDAEEILWAQGFGTAEAGTDTPVTTSTLFQAGSISKLVTALAALRLVDMGKLDLDADINAYLQTWRVPRVGSWQPRITVRQLLSHSAGTTVHGFTGYRRDEPIPSLCQTLDGIPPAKNPPVRVTSLPGVQFRYSGGGTTIVQMAMMDHMRTSFPGLMDQLVLGPLGMFASRFQQPLPPSLEPLAASGHWTDADIAGGRYYIHPELAAAGLWTTPSDLARLAIGIQRASMGRHNAILRQDTAHSMLRPQIAPHIGLGSFFEGEGAASRWGHSGDTYGFNAMLTVFRETGQGVAIMLNALTGSALMSDLLRTLARDHNWPALGPEAYEPGEVDPATAEAYAGTYRLPSGATLNLHAVDEHLHLQLTGQDPLPLQPGREGRLAASGLDLMVQIDDSRLLLHGSDGPVEAQRVTPAWPHAPGRL